jgi:carbon storage regulator CsrA
MLVLSRRPSEKVYLPEVQTTIEVVSVKPGSVRLGIDAPPDISILRPEVHLPGQVSRPPGRADDLTSSLADLIRARLGVALRGLVELRDRLSAGEPAEALHLADNLNEDLSLLLGRLTQRRAPWALLVEDNPADRHLLTALLRKAGIEVEVAHDGLDALDHLRRRGRPDVVLLDMYMPRCDGPAVIREVRQDPLLADLKIFGVSSCLPGEVGVGFGPEGVDRWFHKPVDPQELIRDVTTLLLPPASSQGPGPLSA